MGRVLFICTANICRSPMAVGIFDALAGDMGLDFRSESAGVAGLNWEKCVVTDPAFLRPAEVDLLLGDPSKAKAKLGWEPRTTFTELVALMVEADLRRAAFEARHGREMTEIR